jgi:hypothetical protein
MRIRLNDVFLTGCINGCADTIAFTVEGQLSQTKTGKLNRLPFPESNRSASGGPNKKAAELFFVLDFFGTFCIKTNRTEGAHENI